MSGRLLRAAVLGLSILGVWFAASPASAQRRGGGESGRSVYKSRIVPHWFAEGAKLWYQNDLPGGGREFVVIDAERGTREVLADREKLDTVLQAAGGDRARTEPAPSNQASTTTATASRRTGAETELTFVNRTAGDVELFWRDTGGQRQSYGKIAAGERKSQHTYGGHVWEVVAAGGNSLRTFEANDAPATVEIDSRVAVSSAPGRSGNAAGGPRAVRGRSADGKWIASIQNHNVMIEPAAGGDAVRLTTDGREGQAYGNLEWSPDSQSLVAFRIEPGDEKEVHFVESSPKSGGRAVLHTRRYPLPGDKFTAYELCLFNVAEQKPIECHVERLDFGMPRLRWSKDGHTFTVQKTDRGHQRLRLIEIDARTGSSRNLIDERTETFIWTAHTENVNLRPFQWLEQTDELIYVSERDGWRHLYLVDAKEGAIKNPITSGEFVVRGIDHIDEERRQVWFQACGRHPDQDPYFIHHYRVNFDGAGLVAVTAGNGTHTVQFSPDRKYIVDSYSRVDQAPIHELRRTSDGQLVCKLDEADIRELQAGDWQPPEVFVAKGRDGQTDIWGIVCKPRDFDPAKKYPVIEQIYAGPHGSFVPKSFSGQRRFAALADLGFIVVQIDGMGTANRSKAFQDVCWQNLKDAGLPDRILWHQALAKKHPWYDISRVGIYGGSAGGQNSTGALLFHLEFYKVGVSGCGCHDNRMDKASWNEQWMGFPVGPHYAACSNIDNAAKLRGKLMLIVGEMDTNVPPESTFRLADALIKAGKDFDMVVVPSAGHGMGGAYGTRRMHDFFVRHLQAREPADRNAE